jgi:integrase
VRELAELYLERHSKPRNKTWREDKRRFDTYIVPELGRHAIAAISRADVAALHAKVGRRGKYEANRVLALVSSMFARAAEWGLLAEGAPNPARGVEPFRERARDRWIRPSEMPRLAQAIAAEPNVYVRAAIWLYLLTGVRKGELLRARWSDVDFERAELRLPETKSGEPHVVPLSSVALRVLSEIPRQAGNPYILPGAKRGTHLVNIGKNWRRIREAAGCADVRLHDLRRTVGSWLATAGASLHLVGTVLNHADTDTTRIYARLADDAARRALEEHAARLLEAARADPARMARAEPQRQAMRAKSDT